ncbi:hypothetical protein Tco_0865385, partial [Tanacetum coccineum]
ATKGKVLNWEKRFHILIGDSFRWIRNSCEEAIFQQQIQGSRFKYYAGGETITIHTIRDIAEKAVRLLDKYGYPFDSASEAKDLPKTNLSDQYKKDCLNVSIKKENKCPSFLEWNQARRRSVRYLQKKRNSSYAVKRLEKTLKDSSLNFKYFIVVKATKSWD